MSASPPIATVSHQKRDPALRAIARSRRFSFDYLVGASINVIALISGICHIG